MSNITVNLLQFHVDLPQEMARTREALSSAHESEQRLWCALHMTKAVALALFNSPLYLGNDITREVYTSFSEGSRIRWAHFLQHADNSRSALKCSAFSICLLFKSLFAGAAAVRPNITVHQGPPMEADAPEEGVPEPPQQYSQQPQEQPQERLQEQLQEQISYLRQDLFRAVRQKLVQDADGLLKKEQWQNELQEHLQSQFRDRLQGLRLAQLRSPLQVVIRQELITLLGEDGFHLEHLSKPIYDLFCKRLLELPKCGRPDSYSPLESSLRTDLIADIFLDLFIDQFLKPLRDLTQNKCQDIFLEKLVTYPYTAICQALFLMVKQETAEERSSDRRRDSPLPNIRDALFQSLVDPTSLLPAPGQDQGLAQKPWESGGYQGMFQLWYQGLLAYLSQRLTTRLLPQCHSLCQLELTAEQLQGQLREMLCHHLLAHLQHMILSSLRDWNYKICDQGEDMWFEIYSRNEWSYNTLNEQIQKSLQEALLELLPGWLETIPPRLLLDPLQGQLNQQLKGAFQDKLQNQIKDGIPNLHRNLIRTVRQKLCQEYKLHRSQHSNALQDQLQDYLQNQLQERLQHPNLSQLQNLFHDLRQELTKNHYGSSLPLNYKHLSPWILELCRNRIQPPPQGRLDRFWNIFSALIPYLSEDRKLPQGVPTLSDLFHPLEEHRVRNMDLRSDLLEDLLLDILLELLIKAWPKSFLGKLQGPLIEERLPDLYRILKKILNENILASWRDSALHQTEEVLQFLRDALSRSIEVANSPQIQGPTTEAWEQVQEEL